MKKEYIKPEVIQLLLSGQDIVTSSPILEQDVTEQDVGWDAGLFGAS